MGVATIKKGVSARRNTQGFTLIELIATLGVLSLILLISVPIIDRVMSDAEGDIDELSIEMINSAASMAASTADLGPVVSVQSLVDGGYIEADKLEGSPLLDGVAVEQDNGYHEYQQGVNRNLVLDSARPRESGGYLVGRYTMAEPWVMGDTYTIQIKGTINAGNHFGIWRDKGYRKLTNLSHDPSTGIWSGTAIVSGATIDGDDLHTMSVYSLAKDSVEHGTIEWIKVERGDTATSYVPSEDD